MSSVVNCRIKAYGIYLLGTVGVFFGGYFALKASLKDRAETLVGAAYSAAGV